MPRAARRRRHQAVIGHAGRGVDFDEIELAGRRLAHEVDPPPAAAIGHREGGSSALRHALASAALVESAGAVILVSLRKYFAS